MGVDYFIRIMAWSNFLA